MTIRTYAPAWELTLYGAEAVQECDNLAHMIGLACLHTNPVFNMESAGRVVGSSCVLDLYALHDQGTAKPDFYTRCFNTGLRCAGVSNDPQTGSALVKTPCVSEALKLLPCEM